MQKVTLANSKTSSKESWMTDLNLTKEIHKAMICSKNINLIDKKKNIAHFSGERLTTCKC